MKKLILTSLLLPLLMFSLSSLQAQPQAQPLHEAQPHAFQTQPQSRLQPQPQTQPQSLQAAQPQPQAQELAVAWEELTSADFKKATGLAQGVCIIPIGVIEKHAQHLPLGTDVYAARHIALTAAKGEYAVVFPFYFAGQIFEARHQPGTIAYSSRMLYDLLDETCREIARNGFDKIIIVNGHGGNTNFLQYFCQTQLEGERNYAVFLFTPTGDKETDRKITELRKSTIGGHADEEETAVMRVIRPDLVHMDRVALESGRDQARLPLPGAYTGIWWYARYPNHYAGDATGSDPEIGRLSLDSSVAQLQQVIAMIKADTTTRELQNRFFQEAREH